jgi:hypothetical protein
MPPAMIVTIAGSSLLTDGLITQAAQPCAVVFVRSHCHAAHHTVERETETARRARGRWARLRAACRSGV